MSIGPSKPPRAAAVRTVPTSFWQDVVSRSVSRQAETVLAGFGIGAAATVQAASASSRTDAMAADQTPLAELGRILTACTVRTECAHFGLLVGQGDLLTALGLAGCLVPGSQTLGDVLGNLVGHLSRRAGAATPMLALELVVQGTEARLSYAMPFPAVEGTDHVADVALALTLNVMRTLCGAGWDPLEVSLPRPPPADLSPFTRFYRSPVRYGADAAALVFPAALLGRPVIEGTDLLATLFAAHFEPRPSPAGAGFGEDVRRVLRTRLLGQQCSAETVAALFSMHRRTLNRHLHEEGLTFNTLVNEIRFEIARRLMTNAGLTLGQIAAALSFSEMSAFTRAFRRWSGQTPTAWRAEHRTA